MPRKKRVTPAIEKTINLSSDLVGKVDLILFDDITGRVPQGAWQRYIERLINNDLQAKQSKQATRGKDNEPQPV